MPGAPPPKESSPARKSACAGHLGRPVRGAPGRLDKPQGAPAGPHLLCAERGARFRGGQGSEEEEKKEDEEQEEEE